MRDGSSTQLEEGMAYARLARQVSMGTIGEPDDIAYAVLCLASDEAKFVTGAELKVDGGISAM
jgi:NAD(P)-dependent dehydrogenase (short-subunit alcohol dehydrogenase family)